MKKNSILFILFASLFISCETESDGCKCKGEFGRLGQSGSFYSNNVDCDTGEPTTGIQGDGAYFMGCVN